jgi:hypothetical protein
MDNLIFNFSIQLLKRGFSLKNIITYDMPFLLMFYSNYKLFNIFFQYFGLLSLFSIFFLYSNIPYNFYEKIKNFLIILAARGINDFKNISKKNVKKFKNAIIIELDGGKLLLLKFDNKLVKETINSEFFFMKDGKKINFNPYPGIPIEVTGKDIDVDEIIQLQEDGNKIIINKEQSLEELEF